MKGGRFPWTGAVVLALALLQGCSAAAQSAWPIPPTQPTQPSAQATGTPMNWKTHCVGRVMMSLPEDRPLTWSTDFDFAVVKRIPALSEQQFWEGVEVVRQRYLAQTHRLVPTRLAHFQKIGKNAAFIASYKSPNSFWGPVLERFVYIDKDHAYEMRTGGLDTPNVAPTPELFRSNFERYTPILSRIHPLAPGQFPSRDGLCVDGAVISGDTGRNARSVLVSEIAVGTRLGIAYRENQYKVELLSGYEELKFDEDHAKNPMGYDGPDAFKEFKVLRKRDRVLAGIAGQEFITRTLRNDGQTFYRMQWTVKGAMDGGVLKPTIVVHLNTPQTATDTQGKPYDKLPPEPELLRLWDYALSTFHWRNGALPDGQHIQAVN
jgi:hypothetical protein